MAGLSAIISSRWLSLPRISDLLAKGDRAQATREVNVGLQAGSILARRRDIPIAAWGATFVEFGNGGVTVIDSKTGRELPAHEFILYGTYRPGSETDNWVRQKAKSFKRPTSERKAPKAKGEPPLRLTIKQRVGFAILKRLYPPGGVAPKGTRPRDIERAVAAEWPKECESQEGARKLANAPPTWPTIKDWQKRLRAQQKRKKRRSSKKS